MTAEAFPIGTTGGETMGDSGVDMAPASAELPYTSPERFEDIKTGLSFAALDQTIEFSGGQFQENEPEGIGITDEIAENSKFEGNEDEDEEDDEEFIPKKPKKQPEGIQVPPSERPKSSNDFDLTGEDMRDAALGFIYITTGIPVDEMMTS